MRTLALLSALTLALPLSLSAAPVTLNWEFPAGYHIRCLGTIGDVDGDLRPEVIVSIDHTGDAAGHLKLLSGVDGDVIWGVSPIGGVSNGCGYGDMCINTAPDQSGDGRPEILFGTSWGGRTAYALLPDALGATLWDFDTYVDDPPSGWVYSLDWIEDLSGDGRPEVVFGCGSDNNRAYCVDGATGALRWKFAAPDAVYQVATIGDVNGNGTGDVLVATGDADGDYTYCIDGGSVGTATWIWRYLVNATSYCCAGIRDVNADGVPDGLIGTWDASGDVVCVNGDDGTVIWTYPVGEYVMRVVPIEDVTGDGTMDVLVASWKNAIICVNGATGGLHWSVPTGTTNGGDVWAIWSLSDVDYDGFQDVIAGSFDLKAYCVSGKDGDLLWDYTVGNRVYSVRGLGDVNGDGVGEAVVGTQYASGGGKVFCLDADGDGTSVPPLDELTCQVESDAVVVRWAVDAGCGFEGFNVYRMDVAPPSGRGAPPGERPESVAEALAARAGEGQRDGMVRLNGALLTEPVYVDRTVADGRRYAYVVAGVAADGEETLAGPVEITADLRVPGLWLSQAAPNPIRSGPSSIAYLAPRGERVTLAVYDAAGRLVRTLVSGLSDGQPATVVWDGSSAGGENVASGVYLVRLAAGGRSETAKVAVLR